MPAVRHIAVFELHQGIVTVLFRKLYPNLDDERLNRTLGATPSRRTPWTALKGAPLSLENDARKLYQAKLAYRVHTQGFQTASTKDAFAVDGIPAALCKQFSKGRSQIEESLRAKGPHRHGEGLVDGGAQYATKETDAASPMPCVPL